MLRFIAHGIQSKHLVNGMSDWGWIPSIATMMMKILFLWVQQPQVACKKWLRGEAVPALRGLMS